MSHLEEFWKSYHHLFSPFSRVQWSRQPWTTLCPCSLPAWWALSPSRWTICPWALQEVWVPLIALPLNIKKSHKRTSELLRKPWYTRIYKRNFSHHSLITAVRFMSSKRSVLDFIDGFRLSKEQLNQLCPLLHTAKNRLKRHFGHFTKSCTNPFRIYLNYRYNLHIV